LDWSLVLAEKVDTIPELDHKSPQGKHMAKRERSVMQVTEKDFRLPEYKDAKAEDYEFRSDGTIARKDRWITGIRKIASIVGFSGRDEWEIDDIVEKVKQLDVVEREWMELGGDWSSVPDGRAVDVRLVCGSVLRNAVYQFVYGRVMECVIWNGNVVPTETITGVRLR
jgi:hypothetical protein